MNETWDRTAAIQGLRPILWRYLSPKARVTSSPGAPDIVDLAPGDLQALAATHLAVSESVALALDTCEVALRDLPSSITASRQDLVGFTRGPVDWSQTFRRRIAEAEPTLFVCRPPERLYDTPLARLIAYTLSAVGRLADLSRLPNDGEVGSLVHEASQRARRLHLHPKLRKVNDRRFPSLSRTQPVIERRPQFGPIRDAASDFHSIFVEGSPSAALRLLERHYLAPSDDARIFELQIGLTLLEALNSVSIRQVQPSSLLPSGRAPFALLRDAAMRPWRIWWQRPIWAVATEGGTSTWSSLLQANGLSQVPLRPDFLIEAPDGHVIPVEVKLTTLEGFSPDRVGLRDMLAYLHDAEDLLRDAPKPHGIVAAWNSTATPALDAPVLIANQRDIGAAVRHVAAQHLARQASSSQQPTFAEEDRLAPRTTRGEPR